MGRIFQLKTKKKINNKIGAGFVFNVPSKWSTGHPSDTEIKEALINIGGKDAGMFCSFDSSKYEIIS